MGAKTVTEDDIVAAMNKITPENEVNILVVGLPGAGKSTLVTSLVSCITHKHDIELAPVGKYNSGDSFTIYMRRYQKLFKNCSNIKKSPAVMYDMPGLLNQADERFDAILSCILKGAVPPNENILVDAFQTKAEIEQKFNTPDSERMIDRVIFVHSCTVEIPDNLTETVVRVCQKFDVLLFSVLTHIDQMHDTSDLQTAVGTVGSPRGFEIELYHTGTRDKQGRYKDKPETNNELYKLWKGLLNQNYPRKSETTKMAVRVHTPDCDENIKYGVPPVNG